MPRDKLPMKDVKATKWLGELHRSVDPSVSEWGNPTRVMFGDPQMNS